jgi:hypothetical protein
MHNILKNQIVKLIGLLECTMMGIKLYGKNIIQNDMDVKNANDENTFYIFKFATN